jgi:hypothetical protein
MVIRKSPLAPLCQRGVIPPFGKGRLGGILQINAVVIMKLLINKLTPTIFHLRSGTLLLQDVFPDNPF